MNNEFIKHIEHCISSMHYANQTVASAYGGELSVVENSILVELLENPRQKAKILAERLILSPVVISRTLKELKIKNLIDTKKSGRSLECVITNKGQKVFWKTHDKAKEIFSSAYSRLIESEQVIFAEALSKMLDNLNAQPAASLAEDPPLMPNIRRLTRALGFISNTIYFNKDINPLEWHVLRQLVLKAPDSAPLLAITIAENLGIEKNTLFPVIRRMVSKSLIAQESSQFDRREKPLSLLLAGQKQYQSGKMAALKILQLAFRDFKESQLIVLVDLWGKYTNTKNSPTALNITADYQTLKINDLDFRKRSRAFLFKARVAANQLENLPAVIIGENSQSFALTKDSKILSVIEISEQNELLHFIDSNEIQTQKIPNHILKSFWQNVFAQSGLAEIKNIKFERSACTERTWKVVNTHQ